MINFSTEPEFQKKLDWIDKFAREECETMDLLWPEMAGTKRPDWNGKANVQRGFAE